MGVLISVLFSFASALETQFAFMKVGIGIIFFVLDANENNHISDVFH